MAITTVATAIQILNGTWTAVQNLRERIEASKDKALKASYGGLLDDFNRLRLIVIKLTEENEALSQTQAEKQTPIVRHVGDTNYYFVGDQGPYCQPCYDRDQKLVPLTAQQKFAGGTGRKCQLCNTVFFEVHKRTTPTQRRPYRSFS
jgi:hypothetical protein